MHAPDQTKRSASTSPLRVRPWQPCAADHSTPADRQAFHRFLWADRPSGQSWNLYSYVRNNPLRNVDPSGQDCITATNQTATSVTVGVASGNCSGNAANQTYVAGTVNTSTLTYNGTSIGFNYTPDDASSNLGAGHVDLGPAPSDALSASAQATLGQVGTWTTDRTIFRGAALWMAQIGPVHLGMVEDMPPEEGGTPGSRTAPTLPPKVIAKEGEVEIVHYTRSGDHGPPHVHVRGGGPETRIGQNGKPLAGDPELTPTQRAVVQQNLPAIRRAVDKIGRYHDYNNQ